MNNKEEDGNTTLEAIYGKVENHYNKENETKENETKEDETKEDETKEDEPKEDETKEDEKEESNKIFRNKLKKHKNFDKRGQKFNKSKNRNTENKRYETYDNDI